MQSLHILDSSLYPNGEPLDASISREWYTPFIPSPGPEPSLENVTFQRDYLQGAGTGVRPHDYNYAPYFNCDCKPIPAHPIHVYAPEMVGNPHNMPTQGLQFSPREPEFAPFRVRQKPRDPPRYPSPPFIKSEFFNLDAPATLEDTAMDRENQIVKIKVDRTRDDDCSLSSFQEALGVVEQRDTPSTSSSSSSEAPFRSNRPIKISETVGTMGLGLASSKQEEVLKAAKSLFSKRTRTLYQWLCPDASKTKLKASVSAAWDTLSEPEKHFYISQVLGRFGLRESSLMVNPQLDGIKGLPGGGGADPSRNSMRASIFKARAAVEDQEAVNALFQSCDDAHSWTSFRRQKTLRAPRKPRSPPPEKEKRKKRKYVRRNLPNVHTPVSAPVAKRAKIRPKEEPLEEVELRVDGGAPGGRFENDEELRNDAENIAVEEEFWNNPLNPAELFPEINF